MRTPVKPHWYRFYFGECPVCGKDKSYRERIYGIKPSNVEERVVFLTQEQTFDNRIY